jgi:hypothetical protein
MQCYPFVHTEDPDCAEASDDLQLGRERRQEPICFCGGDDSSLPFARAHATWLE